MADDVEGEEEDSLPASRQAAKSQTEKIATKAGKIAFTAALITSLAFCARKYYSGVERRPISGVAERLFARQDESVIEGQRLRVAVLGPVHPEHSRDRGHELRGRR